MEIDKIGVIGAGLMGAGIAQVAACSGFSCVVVDTRSDNLAKSSAKVEKNLQKLETQSVIKGAGDIFDRIQWHPDLERLRNCQLVIEAVPEDENIKKEVFRSLDAILPEEAIIASNTSSISITRLAHFTARPQKFIGMHFMNPVPVMKLVEIIKGYKTSNDTVALVCQVAQKMGKTKTIVNDYPGFVANRVLMPMINEAFYALMEGVASAEDIDLTMKLGCNQPMGPLALADFIGLDTCLAIMDVLHKGLGDSKYRPCPKLRNYVEAGLLGRKTGHGVFLYQAE
jgi:3-hydroxybutyryl-CoA dehydrogenase